MVVISVFYWFRGLGCKNIVWDFGMVSWSVGGDGLGFNSWVVWCFG